MSLDKMKQQDKELLICNLVSRGKTLKEARKIARGAKMESEEINKPADYEKPKLTAAERKAKLIARIEKHGGEAPASGSIAVYETFLNELIAKKKAEKEEKSED